MRKAMQGLMLLEIFVVLLLAKAMALFFSFVGQPVSPCAAAITQLFSSFPWLLALLSTRLPLYTPHSCCGADPSDPSIPSSQTQVIGSESPLVTPRAGSLQAAAALDLDWNKSLLYRLLKSG